MHIQLAAVYFLKLSKAQAAEDWETAERLDGNPSELLKIAADNYPDTHVLATGSSIIVVSKLPFAAIDRNF